MNSLLPYILETSVCLGAFYLLYWLWLRQETCFRYNRFYLLGASALSLLLPLLEIPSFGPEVRVAGVVRELAPYVVQVTSNEQVVQETATPFDWGFMLWLLYGAGAGFFAFRFLRQLYSLYRFGQKQGIRKETYEGIPVVYTQGQLPTFSFFHYIFWDNTLPLTPHEKARVLQHEQAHVQQKHSFDLVYLEVLLILFWFNPLLHLYRNSLRATHEFLADAQVLQTTDQSDYGLLLARQVLHKTSYAVGHFFNQSLTLKRLQMIHKTHRRTPKAKQWLALPLLGLLTVSLSSHQLLPAAKSLPVPFLSSSTPSSQQKAAEVVVWPTEGLPMMKHFLHNLRVPASAKGKQEHGAVFVQITLDQEGKLSNHKVLQAAHPSLEKEVLRVLQNAPIWKTTNAAWTPSTFIFPVEFRFHNKGESTAAAKQDFQERMAFVISQVQDPSIKIVRPMVVSMADPVTSPKKPQAKVAMAPSAPTPAAPVEPAPAPVVALAEPQFPGGKTALLRFIANSIRIPLSVSQNVQYGTVFLKVTIAKDGTPGDFTVLQASNPALEEEVVRVFRKMPKWESNGATSPVTFVFPVYFIIDSPKVEKETQKKSFQKNRNQVMAQIEGQPFVLNEEVVVVGYGPNE